MKFIHFSSPSVYLIFSVLIGCSVENPGRPNENKGEPLTGELLSMDRTGSYEKNSFVHSFFQSSKLPKTDKRLLLGAQLLSSALFDTERVNQFFNFKVSRTTGYRVEYTTLNPYNRKETIRASGLLLIPPFFDSSHSLPLLVYHRSTLLKKSEAPGFMPKSLLEMDPLEDGRFMMAFLSMQGFIVLAPDYTGYGSSENIPPPYLHKKSVTRTTEDMLYAVTDMLRKENILFKKEIFIMGYSQGGHGALAFAQNFQNNPREFNIKAIAAGGGPYDLPETMAELISQKTVVPIPMILFLQSYSYIYGWNLNQIMKRRSYADIISSDFKQEDTGKSAAKLPQKVQSLFQPWFIKSVQNKNNDPVQETLEENSVYLWYPSSPVFLFHGKEDNIVPYKNMNTAYKYFREGGGAITKKDCDFKKIDSLSRILKLLRDKFKNLTKPNHINCNFMFFLEAGDYFHQYKD